MASKKWVASYVDSKSGASQTTVSSIKLTDMLLVVNWWFEYGIKEVSVVYGNREFKFHSYKEAYEALSKYLILV